MEYRAGIITAVSAIVDSLGGLSKLLPPGHAVLATRAVTSLDGNYVEYLVEGPILPPATLGQRPRDVYLDFTHKPGPGGTVITIGTFVHARDRPWTVAV